MRLLELCADKADWTEKIKDAEETTHFAITTRYPGEYEEATKENVVRSIKIASLAWRLCFRAKEFLFSYPALISACSATFGNSIGANIDAG